MSNDEANMSSGPGSRSRALSPHVPLETVVMLVNPASGSVGPKAADEAMEIFESYGLNPSIRLFEPGRFDEIIDQALADKPDVIVVLAGDGTAGTIASRAGADGPVIAPLPGGTMNMLPKALYHTVDWKHALHDTLSQGRLQKVAGGEIDGHRFYCAAILGSPALWAPAREAMRGGRLNLAWRYAQRALSRSFSGHIRFAADGSRERRAICLTLISPVISEAVDESDGLETAILNPADAGEAVRLAAHAVLDDWRRDPSVATHPARRISLRSRSRIPAALDGEIVNLGRRAEVRYIPQAFRALVPPPPITKPEG